MNQCRHPSGDMVQYRARNDLFSFCVFLLVLTLPGHGLAGCKESTLTSRLAGVPRLDWTLQAVLPHDREAFTEGFLFRKGRLYESTGHNGSSSLREVDAASGRILRIYRLPKKDFGEGLCLVGRRLVQLTWQTETAYVYDLGSFSLLDKFHYEGEGWGLAAGDGKIFMSNGSPNIAVRDPQTFLQLSTLTVHDASGPIDNINELEYINKSLFANVWKEDLLLRIDAESGAVTGYIALDSLPLQDRNCENDEEVANGIAYDDESGLLYITGKRWPSVFVLKLYQEEDR